MKSWFHTWRELRKRGVMGINRRNADYVLRLNPRRLYPLVDDKIRTKLDAQKVGVHVPELYGIIESEHDINDFESVVGQHRDFVIKPAQGAGGDGVMVISDRFEGHYKGASGRILKQEDIEFHLSGILSGIYSLGGARDRAMVEYRVISDPLFSSISWEGVPDIRIILLHGYPVAAMLRLPTRQSGGKANLHQGAIGVGLDIATGVTTGGTWLNQRISRHPDTNNPVAGLQLPDWHRFLEIAAGSYELAPLGYMGVDLVLDKDQGPLMLELNARPGLNIQIANNRGMLHCTEPVLEHVEGLRRAGRQEDVAARVAFSKACLGHAAA